MHLFQNIYLKNKYFISRKSYSMDKEDLNIINYFKDKKNGFYIDVGCFHPLDRNNTYLLYKKNWRGINIDVSKFSIDLFNFLRPDDINVNVGISDKNSKIKVYYQKELSQLTTTIKDHADKFFQGSIKEKIIESKTLNSLLDSTKYKNKKIDFLDIDVEGADLDVLNSLNFEIYRPELMCIEIIEKNIENSLIYEFLKKNNYIKIWSGAVSHLFKDNLI